MSPIQKILLLLPLAAGAALANSSVPLAGLAGAPGEADCTSCHGSSIGGGAVRVELVPAGLSYTPSQTLRVRVTVEDPTAVIWGFQITARNTSNTAQASGRLSSISSDTRVQTDGGVDFLSQTTSGTQRGTRMAATWEFNWTAPASGSNRVTFYVAGLAGNGNGSESGGAGSGDKSYRAQLTLFEGIAPQGFDFVPVEPCRISDTRNAPGPFGQPFLSSLSTREIAIPNSGCKIPTDAAAYSLNVTVVPRGSLGFLTIWPTGQPRPVVSTLNSLDGRIKANAAIVPAGTGGAVSVFVTDATELIIDINGYFIAPHASSMAFVATNPCRVLDTRLGTGPFGGPGLLPLETRSIQVRSSPCIVEDAAAYAINATVIPANTLGYLTLWPSGIPRPTVSTLNATTGTIVANAAIVPASPTGSIDIFATDATHLVLDLVGYFLKPGASGLRFHTLVPCRGLDTRNPNGVLGGPALVGAGSREFPISSSTCGALTDAVAYSLNATVWPTGPMGYLTLWPGGETMPVASTLNALDGALTSNAAILRSGKPNGAIRVFGLSDTHFFLDINGYFK